MNDMIGMDTEQAAGVLRSVGSLSGNLDSIHGRLAEIRMASINPASFLDPTSLILAPESIVDGPRGGDWAARTNGERPR
jgi:hypothetical protein